MATISSLVVKLTANTSGFAKGMRKSKQSLRGFTSQIISTQRRMMGFAKGMIAAAGIGGLVALTKSQMQSLDATAKLSHRLGMATENLIALRHAAELGGSSSAVMDKSIEQLTRRLGEAQLGLGQAKYALDEMGLSVSKLIKNNPAKNFELIAKKIMGLSTSAEKANAAYQLFGRQGVELLNVLESVAYKGIGGVVKEAEKLGIIFTSAELKGIEDANDAMERFKTSASALYKMVLVKIAPVIEKISSKLVNFIRLLRTMPVETWENIKSFTVFIAKTYLIIKAVGWLRKGLIGLVSVIKALAKAKAVLLALSGPKGLAVLALGLAAAIPATIAVNKAFDKIGDQYKVLSDVGAAIKDIGDNSKTASNNVNNLAGSVSNVAESRIKQLRTQLANIGASPYARAVNAIPGATAEQRGNVLFYTKRIEAMTAIAEKSKYLISLQRELDMFGLEGAKKQFYEIDEFVNKIKSIQDLDPIYFRKALELAEKIRATITDITRAAKKQELKEFGESIRLSVRSPLEKFKDKADELHKVLIGGAINQETFARAIQEARDRLDRSVDKKRPFTGSEGREIDTRYVSIAGLAIGGIDPVVGELQKQTASIQKAEQYLQKIATKETLS